MIKISLPFIEVSRLIKTSPEALWDLITDTSRWIEWGPSITMVECRDQNIRMGSEGRVKTVFGFWVPFIITAFDKGKYWSWNVSGIHANGHRIEVVEKGRCRFIFEIPLFAVVYSVVCKIAMRRIARILESSQ